MTTIAGTTSESGRWGRAVGVLRRRTWLIVGVSLAGPVLAAAVTLTMAGPGSSSPEIVTAVAFLVSLAVGCLVALLLEGPERGLQGAAEVKAALGLPTFGVVPVAAPQDGRVHLAVGREPATAYAGAVRSVLDAVRAGDPCRVLLVTSTLPGEGKTTLAVSLAALAARSERVLLIDLDLR